MPSFRAAPVRVRVPASSANLGPGFDSFGLALSLYDDVVVQVVDDGLEVDVAGEGSDSVKRNEKHLVVSSMRAAFDAMGGQPRGLHIVCANRIPHGRGLGSSAAAIVAGLVAASQLTLGGMTDDELLQLACRIEGHPDNVAAALLGGFTAAWRREDGSAAAVRLPLAAGLTPVAFVPATAVSTAKSRSLLPPVVPLADAAHTAVRAALLPLALTTRPDLLLDATEDRLHQPARLEAQPRGRALVAKLRTAGHAAVLSGSGPTVLALCTSPAAAAEAVELAGKTVTAMTVDIDNEGATVVPL